MGCGGGSSNDSTPPKEEKTPEITEPEIKEPTEPGEIELPDNEDEVDEVEIIEPEEIVIKYKADLVSTNRFKFPFLATVDYHDPNDDHTSSTPKIVGLNTNGSTEAIQSVIIYTDEEGNEVEPQCGAYTSANEINIHTKANGLIFATYSKVEPEYNKTYDYCIHGTTYSLGIFNEDGVLQHSFDNLVGLGSYNRVVVYEPNTLFNATQDTLLLAKRSGEYNTNLYKLVTSKDNGKSSYSLELLKENITINISDTGYSFSINIENLAYRSYSGIVFEDAKTGVISEHNRKFSYTNIPFTVNEDSGNMIGLSNSNSRVYSRNENESYYFSTYEFDDNISYAQKADGVVQIVNNYCRQFFYENEHVTSIENKRYIYTAPIVGDEYIYCHNQVISKETFESTYVEFRDNMKPGDPIMSNQGYAVYGVQGQRFEDTDFIMHNLHTNESKIIEMIDQDGNRIEDILINNPV